MTIQTKYNIGDVVKCYFSFNKETFFGRIVDIQFSELSPPTYVVKVKHGDIDVAESEIICRMVEEKE